MGCFHNLNNQWNKEVLHVPAILTHLSNHCKYYLVQGKNYDTTHLLIFQPPPPPPSISSPNIFLYTRFPEP